MKKIGKQTILFENPPSISECFTIVGPKESQGPLSSFFDKTLDDEFWGEKSWEKAESKILKETINSLILKSNTALSDIDLIFSGDLLNQCISSNFGIRNLSIPLFGTFGACSTFVEAMSLSAICVESFAKNCICATSSHFCSAEKQFRFPLELGNQRPQTSQWTVTGAGASLISKHSKAPFIKSITPGKIVDLGIKDANNMGAAMAPAFVDTLITHLKDTNRPVSYYDLIFSGDLGYVGKELAIDLARQENLDLSKNYEDCGVLIFNKDTQDTHSGGSGCACSASVFSSLIFDKLKNNEYKKILLIATGALMNSTTSQQGESIPAIAHAIDIECD